VTERQKATNLRAYQKKVAEHRCITCGKQDERTLSGKVRCNACFEKYREISRRRKPKTREQRDKENADKRAWAAKLKSLHACTRCGTKDKRTLNGYTTCAICAAKHRRWQRNCEDKERKHERTKKLRDLRREQGLCPNCGGKREEPDRVLCIDCRVRARMNDWRRKQAKQAGVK